MDLSHFFPFGVDLDEIKQSSFSKFIFDHYAKSYFWTRKVFQGFQITCRSCFKKTFLIHSSKIMIECQKTILVNLKIIRKRTFGPFEQLKLDRNRIFEQFINHVIVKSSNMRFWSSLYCSKVNKNCLLKEF